MEPPAEGLKNSPSDKFHTKNILATPPNKSYFDFEKMTNILQTNEATKLIALNRWFAITIPNDGATTLSTLPMTLCNGCPLSPLSKESPNFKNTTAQSIATKTPHLNLIL